MKNCITIILIAFAIACSAEANTGYQGLLLTPEKLLTPYKVTDKAGRDVMFPDANGKYQLVFFGYTSCPDVCPTTLHKIKQVMKGVVNSSVIDFVFISIDTERDGPENLKAFVEYFHPDIKGLSGNIHNIKKIENQFGILTRKFQGKSALGYQLEHSVYMYLINKQGRLMLMYPGSTTSAQIITDLNLLINTEKIAVKNNM